MVFRNQSLHTLSDGRLGFSTEVRGLAADSRRLGVAFKVTAEACWVLGLLALRLEETSRLVPAGSGSSSAFRGGGRKRPDSSG